MLAPRRDRAQTWSWQLGLLGPSFGGHKPPSRANTTNLTRSADFSTGHPGHIATRDCGVGCGTVFQV